MAVVNLWNWMVPGVESSLNEAANQFKRMKRPVPELVAFYDRAIALLNSAKDRQVKRKAKKLAKVWEQRKAEYLASVLAGNN